MIYIVIIYIINLLFVLYLAFKPNIPLSLQSYTLLFIIIAPFFTPIVLFLTYFDEQLIKRNQIHYSPIYLNASTTILTNGETFFDDLISEIDKAKHYILINLFLFHTDNIGQKIIDCLTKKQKEGVQVIVIYDAVARRKLKKKYFRPLINHGGMMLKFQPFILNKRLNLNLRNHRKIILIDHNIAYLGGFNIGDEYLNRDPKLGLWSDLEVKLSGDLEPLFKLIATDIQLINKSLPIQLKPAIQPNSSLANETVRLIASGLTPYRLNPTYQCIFTLITKAQTNIKILTPYLIIPDSLIDALLIAASKGVKIDIIIPSKNDHPLANNLSRAYAYKLLHPNIAIYLYPERAFLHAKAILIDESLVFITSANLDYRSLYYNLECGILSESKQLISHLYQQFSEKKRLSQQFTQSDCKFYNHLAMLIANFY